MGTTSHFSFSSFGSLTTPMLWVLVAGAALIHALGVFEGYLLRSWMGHAKPTSFELMSKALVGGALMLVYVASLIWGMVNPGYSTPMPLHAFIGLIVGALFPKRFFRSGKDGFELGMTSSGDPVPDAPPEPRPEPRPGEK